MPSLDFLATKYAKAKDRDSRVGSLRDRILSTCTPAQVPFVADPHTSLALLTPRRAGKTSAILRRKVLGAATKRRSSFLYCAMSRPHAEELMWVPLKRYLEELSIPAELSESELTATFSDTESRIKLIGADDKREADKQRGSKHHGVSIDEAASFPSKLLKYLLDEVIRPALMDFRGWRALTGTPSTQLAGVFYDATRTGAPRTRYWDQRESEEWRDRQCRCPGECSEILWSAHSWTLADNTAEPHLWSEALKVKAQEGWSDENPIWQREYLGRWVGDDTGRVYRYKQRDGSGQLFNGWFPGQKTRDNPFGLPSGYHWRYVYGLDLGFKDSVALEVFAYSDTCPNLYHVDEYTRRGMSVHDLAQVLKGRIEKTGYPDGIFADLAGNGGMILKELQDVYGIAIEAAEKKNKPDAIELMNSDLTQGRCKVMIGSQLEREMLELQWDESMVKENKAQSNHACDAAIYARRGALHHFAHDEAPKSQQQRAARSTAHDIDDDDERPKHRKKIRQLWDSDGPDYDDPGMSEENWRE